MLNPNLSSGGSPPPLLCHFKVGQANPLLSRSLSVSAELAENYVYRSATPNSATTKLRDNFLILLGGDLPVSPTLK